MEPMLWWCHFAIRPPVQVHNFSQSIYIYILYIGQGGIEQDKEKKIEDEIERDVISIRRREKEREECGFDMW